MTFDQAKIKMAVLRPCQAARSVTVPGENRSVLSPAALGIFGASAWSESSSQFSEGRSPGPSGTLAQPGAPPDGAKKRAAGELGRSAFALSGGMPCNTIRDMKIHEFIWPEDRVAHITRHGVRPEEVEEVCFGRALVQRTKSAGVNPVYLCPRPDSGWPVSLLCRHPVSGRQRLPSHCTSHDVEGTAAVQPMEKPMNTPKIPHTDSIAELARFWDTHDLTDFEDELEEVPESVFECRAEETVTIHLPAPELEAVKRLAKAKGMGHTAHPF
jgi:hypothetical protein